MRDIQLRITQGAVRVASAFVEHEADGIALVTIDCDTKYPELGPVGGGDWPMVGLCASGASLHLDETQSRDAVTIVDFPEFAGWEVFCCDGSGRYEMRLALVRREAGA